jgi:hypothetical protein
MSDLSQEEAVAVAASIVGVESSEAAGMVVIVAMKDGQVGISATGECECSALQVIARAIERISDSLHRGETVTP